MGKLEARFKVKGQTFREVITTPGADHNIVSEFVDAAARDNIQAGRKGYDLRLYALEERLQKVVREEFRRAFNFVAHHMIGARSRQRTIGENYRKIIDSKGRSATRTEDTVKLDGVTRVWIDPKNSPARETVEWMALSQRTIRTKLGPRNRQQSGTIRARNSAYKFFLHTGGLRNEILNKAYRMANATGLVRGYTRNENKRIARITKMRKKIPLGKLTLKIAPRIPISAYLQNDGALERRLGMSGLPLQKLMGRSKGTNEVQRPMLRPVFTFYMNYMIPREIGRELSKTLLRERPTNTDGREY